MSSNQGIFLSRNQVAGRLNIYLIVRSSALDIFLSVVFQNENWESSGLNIKKKKNCY